MTTALETAFPLAANWVSATVRAQLAAGGCYFSSTAALTGEDFTLQPFAAIAVYGTAGSLVFYAYDSADTTTADDAGLTTIVVSGRRYKRAAELILRDAVLSATTAAQPASPSIGDAYILTAAPTGTDWASKAKNVATFTARGWVFRAPFVGQVAYVADTATFYHYAAGGTWTAGLGPGSLADGALGPKKLAHPFAILKCVDQRNAPPGSAPTAGTCYQVGTSPTGSFAGQANAVARYTGSAYEFIAPAEGDTIYRVDAAVLYTYRSGAWGASYAPNSHRQAYAETNTESASSTIAVGANKDLTSRSITGASGQILRVSIPKSEMKEASSTPATFTYVFQLFADSESTPRMESPPVTMLSTTSGTYFRAASIAVLEAAIGDAAAHTWTVRLKKTAQTASGANNRCKVSVTWEVLNLS